MTSKFIVEHDRARAEAIKRGVCPFMLQRTKPLRYEACGEELEPGAAHCKAHLWKEKQR